jgi:sec-independent protein translocase protein TatA
MFGLGSTEILIILAILALVVGAGKLPEAARSLGQAFGMYNKAKSEVRKATDISTWVTPDKDDDKKNKQG